MQRNRAVVTFSIFLWLLASINTLGIYVSSQVKFMKRFRICFSGSGPELSFGGTSRYLTLCRSKYATCYHVLTATRAAPFLS